MTVKEEILGLAEWVENPSGSGLCTQSSAQISAETLSERSPGWSST
jgi:hypothetical protein